MARKGQVQKPVFTTKYTEEQLQYFREVGRQGGKVGGKLRWKGVSAAERTAHAKRAVAAREAKRKKKK
jgi:hypothetical protein